VELHDVTRVAFHKWCVTRRFVSEVDLDANTITTIGEQLKSYSGWPAKTRFYLENFKAALDTPGEWFLSRQGTLYYMPLPGEDMTQAEVIAPVAEKLVVIARNPEQDRYDEHSNIADPMFVDPENNDYHLPPNSPALKIGFKPFDYSQAGVYGEASWIEKAARAKMPELELAPH
jgi:hypothetical protein